MWNNDAGPGQLQRGVCPITFTAGRAFRRPRLRNVCPRRVEQIVYVPVKAFLSTKVAPQSSSESAGAERAADIEIETGGEAEPSSPANADVARAV